MNVKLALALTAALAASPLLPAADIALPAPGRKGGMPLMQTLNQRKSSRAYAEKQLPSQTVSDLLWAASGVNRPDGRMTAPTARNIQEITLYAILPSGAYRYDAKANRLAQVSIENLTQSVTGKAPLTVVYVADTKKQPNLKMSAVDCGFIGQNIYLYCASAGLSTVIRGSFDKGFISKLNLPEGSEVFFIQSVGFPK